MSKMRSMEENVKARAAKEPAKTSDERKFPYEVLKENCVKLFHVTSALLSGQLSVRKMDYIPSQRCSILSMNG